jgi:hypothetical protein
MEDKMETFNQKILTFKSILVYLIKWLGLVTGIDSIRQTNGSTIIMSNKSANSI